MKVPTWFNLKNYVGARDLDAAGWHIQLAARQWFQSLIERKIPLPDPAKDALSRIRQRPIIDRDSPKVLQDLFLPVKKQHAGRSIPPVGKAAWLLDPSELLMMIDQNVDGNSVKPGFVWRREDKHAFLAPIEYIGINLLASDAEVFEDFQSCIRDLRKQKYGAIARRHKPDFPKWVDAGVLPYLDLKIWADLEKHRFPPKDLAKKLQRDLEQVRKLPQLIDRVMSPTTFECLQFLSASKRK